MTEIESSGPKINREKGKVFNELFNTYQKYFIQISLENQHYLNVNPILVFTNTSIVNTYIIHKLTPFSHGGRQKLQNATDPYILLSPRPHSSYRQLLCIREADFLNLCFTKFDVCYSGWSCVGSAPEASRAWRCACGLRNVSAAWRCAACDALAPHAPVYR